MAAILRDFEITDVIYDILISFLLDFFCILMYNGYEFPVWTWEW